MDILHISDLHVTTPGDDLRTVWNAASAAIGARRFGFIVVSGDLTRTAGENEFREVERFAESALEPLLLTRDRARIIFVPGNHDVGWDMDCFEPCAEADYAAALKDIRADPDHSRFRYTVKSGQLKVFRVKNEVDYRRRLKNVDDFMRRYYGDVLSQGQHRAFDLSGSPGRDWSAHVFADERVAFFGLNTCHRNDALYHGAHIHQGVFADIKQHADRLDDTLKIAVWHHGLIGPRGAHDHLTLQQLGELNNAGFRVGFHGHIHQASFDSVQLVSDRFVLVSTGSIGASRREREDTIGNQFSVVQILPPRLRVDVFERDGNYAQYRLADRYHRQVQMVQVPREQPRQTTAGEHRRTWRISPDGIASVEVELTDLDLRQAPLPLALVAPPYCSVQRGKARRMDGLARVATYAVNEEKLSGNRRRYTLDAPPGRYQKLQWKYAVSNAFALTRGELELLDNRSVWFPNLSPGYDVVSHTARIECDRLVLSIEFRGDKRVADLASAYCLAEREVGAPGEVSYENVPSELRRCVLTGSESSLTLTVDAPSPGIRYAIAYRPADPGFVFPDGSRLVARRLLDHCRAKKYEEGSLGVSLTHTLSRLVLSVLGHSDADGPLLGERGAWVGALWHFDKRRLLPSFGEFRPGSWGTRFACGSGVAGHAFRFCDLASWHQEEGKRSLIFQEIPEPHSLDHPQHGDELALHGDRPYSWILCFPLRLRREGPAIGVIGIAGSQDTAAERSLERLARTDRSDEDRALLTLLEARINGAFWTRLRALPDQTVQRFAENVLQHFGWGGVR
jgi:3',5'-cyclic AMP phosphodiesterase CpdA